LTKIPVFDEDDPDFDMRRLEAEIIETEKRLTQLRKDLEKLQKTSWYTKKCRYCPTRFRKKNKKSVNAAVSNHERHCFYNPKNVVSPVNLVTNMINLQTRPSSYEHWQTPYRKVWDACLKLSDHLFTFNDIKQIDPTINARLFSQVMILFTDLGYFSKDKNFKPLLYRIEKKFMNYNQPQTG